MKADKVEVTWDNEKNKWLVRIVVGEEVIRRYCDDSKSADAETLRASAVRTARDEGYEVDPAMVAISSAG